MAVFTTVTTADLGPFLAAYDVGELVSFEGIAEGVENTNYHLTTSRARYILTLYEKRVAPGDLPFFLTLMTFLADAGVPTARAIPQRSGTALGQLCGRPAALIEHLRGAAATNPTPAQCNAAGVALADMHLATTHFDGARSNALGPSGWQTLLANSAFRADEVEPGLGAQLQQELAEVSAGWPKDLPKGVIHGDLFPDNVLFERDQLSGLIDFYFACTDFYAYDLAITINAWCFDSGGVFDAPLSAALVNGYQSRRPLSAAEAAALPQLARGAALRFILTRLTDWLNHDPSALVTAKNPLALLPNLRFHSAASPSVYGV